MKRLNLFNLTLAVALISWLLSVNTVMADGKGAFDAKNCASCHQTAGPAQEKTIEDQLAKKGPELWYSGSKFQPGFLEKWLADPQPIRPMKYYSVTEKNKGDHPKLAAGDAKAVADWLMTLKSADVKDGSIKPSNSIQGKTIFSKKQGCYGCHHLEKGGKVIGGMSAPSLVGAGKRLNPDWIYAYMTNPKVFKPVKDMPVYVGVLNDIELKAVAEYVSSF
ncbi:MAG: c-type cytochrome [Deltaproteobacteria bacterium]|nr:c-type cytochrome [Deltaproteobacteria bacterium]